MQAFIAISAGLLSLIATLPYIVDIVRGKVLLARSTRLMYVLLLFFALLQQKDLESGWIIVLTISELAIAVIIFFFSFKYGVGGIDNIDKACYLLLFLNLVIWQSTSNALVGLHLSIIADAVATFPLIHKTYKNPNSETITFYAIGSAAAFLIIFAETNLSYSTIIFPLYIAGINLLVVLLIRRKRSNANIAQ